MKEHMRRIGLLVMAMLPIVAVAFAAKSALSIAKIGKAGATTHDLADNNTSHSRG